MLYKNTIKPTITEEVTANKHNKFIYQNLCSSYLVNNILFRKDLMLENYLDIIMAECFDFDLNFNDRFESRYMYKPKNVSYDIYDTIDLWWLLLWINYISCDRELTKSTIKVFSPESMDVLNKIFTLEKDRILASQNNPYVIEG